MNLPEDLKYTAEHEWVRATEGRHGCGSASPTTRRSALGDIVYVSLPERRHRRRPPGEPMGEVESTKSVSDVYAPVAGTVLARNEALDAQPELLNSDPYGEGWIVEIEVGDTGVVDALLDAAAYRRASSTETPAFRSTLH